MEDLRVAIVGATGLVGKEVLSVLEKRAFPLKELRCFASEKSLGKSYLFRGEKKQIVPPDFSKIDLVFLCAGARCARNLRKELSSTYVIDLSSAFRQDPKVPLIIPEINAELLEKNPSWIASPNCVATLLLMALFPLHKHYHIQRIVGSTYQSASGGGKKMLKRLLQKRPNKDAVPYAFNVFPHDSELLSDGFNAEEQKIEQEVQKILQLPHLAVSMSCVRVPVARAHSLSIHVTFKKTIALDEVYEIISSSPGVKIFEYPDENRFATPYDATNQDLVYISRIRKDRYEKNALLLWIVGDQLLKGAALNAVQIAEKRRRLHDLHSSPRS